MTDAEALPLPDEAPEPAPPVGSKLPFILRTWYGALALAFLAVGGFLIVGQLVPGIVVAVGLAVQGKLSQVPAEAEAQIIPYLPVIVFWGVGVAAGMVGLLALLKWLAPKPKASGRWRIPWVIGLTVACVLGTQAISWLMALAGLEAKEQDIITKGVLMGSIWFHLAIMVGAPLGEELIFRRLVFSSLDAGCGRGVAYFVSAFLFALIHFHFSLFVAYMWMAACFTLAYEKTGSYWGAFAVHAFNNSLVLLVMSLQAQ